MEERRGMSLTGLTKVARWKCSDEMSLCFARGLCGGLFLCLGHLKFPVGVGLGMSSISVGCIVSDHIRQMLSIQDVRSTFATDDLKGNKKDEVLGRVALFY